jgi:hypothetical protein
MQNYVDGIGLTIFFALHLKFIVLAQNIAFTISITQDSSCILFGL